MFTDASYIVNNRYLSFRDLLPPDPTWNQERGNLRKTTFGYITGRSNDTTNAKKKRRREFVNITSILKSTILSILFMYCSINTWGQNINTPENFPDPEFRSAVEAIIGVQPGESFTAAQTAKVRYMDIGNPNAKGNIKDLTGIQFFTALESLECYGHQLTSLDLSHNTALDWLDCSYNLLFNIDISNNTALSFFHCDMNQLSSLDVSNNAFLSDFSCFGNELTTLDISNNSILHYLDCSWNPLTNLDVSYNIDLKELNCKSNQLTSLNISTNTALEKIICNNNQLTNLDISNQSDLKSLTCYSNQLSSLDVSNNTALLYLHCNDNQLTNLDVSNNTALYTISCQNNQLTSLSSFVANEGLERGDKVDVRYNYIGCQNQDTANDDIQILSERIGKNLSYEPQKDCETLPQDLEEYKYTGKLSRSYFSNSD